MKGEVIQDERKERYCKCGRKGITEENKEVGNFTTNTY
jgi:hypothetical protein